jgi:hypothetical protein
VQERLLKQLKNKPVYLTEQEVKDILGAIRIYTDETQTQYITLTDYLTYNIVDLVLTTLRGE